MKFPKVNVASIMAVLVVVAIDCVVYRSFRSRPEFVARGTLLLVVLATLPMANLLALVVASLVETRFRGSRTRPGFVAGAAIAMIATIDRLRPGLDLVEAALQWSGLDRWLGTMPQVAAYGAFVIGLPFVFQALAGLAGARVGRAIGDRRGDVPPEAATGSRASLAAFATLMLLASLPALAVELILRRDADPVVARLPAGLEAVVDLDHTLLGPRYVKTGSPLRQLDGVKVRVDQDDQPSAGEGVVTSDDPTVHLQDHRAIRVTLLEGKRVGEKASLPHMFLKPIR